VDDIKRALEGKKLLIFYVGSIHGSQNLKQLHHVRGKRLQDSRFSLMTEMISDNAGPH
jgi:hypothetical protein